MSMLYFVVLLALIGFAAVMGLRRHNTRKQQQQDRHKHGADLENPFK